MRFRAAIILGLGLVLTGCPPPAKPGRTKILEDVPLGNGQRGVVAAAPPGMPNPHGGPAPKRAVEEGPELALGLEGHNSKAQLDRERATLKDAAVAAAFERAFRLTFAAERSKRNPPAARALFQEVLAKEPKFAPAWRGIGYTFVDDNFQLDEAIKAYRQAIETDDAYGPAHYGLAFLFATPNRPPADLEAGKKHFQRAMDLGVEDERRLGERFYRK